MAISKGVPARVIIKATDITVRKFENFTAHNQIGFLVISDDVRHEISLRVEKDEPYPVGTYLVGAASFRTDDYGRLQVSKRGVVLVPEVAAGK